MKEQVDGRGHYPKSVKSRLKYFSDILKKFLKLLITFVMITNSLFTFTKAYILGVYREWEAGLLLILYSLSASLCPCDKTRTQQAYFRPD